MRTTFRAVLAVASAAALTPRSAATQPARDSATAAPPAADPRDVRSIDAILDALYDVISGPPGAPRNWTRFRSLFVPGATLIPTHRGDDGITRPTVLTPDAFAQRVTPSLVNTGFYEHEIGRQTSRFGAVVHVMSAYESKRAATDAKPFARGVNSIQLLDAGDRWYVVTLLWDSERPDLPLPAEYLTPAQRHSSP